jgi:Cu-processing system permease protein
MNVILIIAFNLFRDNLRDKVLYNLLFFAMMLIGGAVILGDLTIAEKDKIVTDMGLAAINMIGVIIAIFWGSG